MKVVGVSGSLRPQSNSRYLLEQALAVLEERGVATELVSLRGKTIKPCLGCYACVKTARCAQDDDDFAAVLEKMREADGIILASPVYVSSVVPQMMALLARATFIAYWNDKFFTGKLGGPITVARRAGHNLAFAQLLLWFFINGVTVPGSTYWNVGTAGARGAVDAQQDQEGIDTVRFFAANLAQHLRKLGS